MKRFTKIKTTPAQRQQLDLEMYGPKHDCPECGLHFRSFREVGFLLKCESCVVGETLEMRQAQYRASLERM